MQYLVLAREDLTNQVEGRALQNKTTAGVCRFLIEEVVCRYRCVGKIVADRWELDAQEAEELFDRLGVKLSLTTAAYNPKANGKVERGHGPIIKALVRARTSPATKPPRTSAPKIVENLRIQLRGMREERQMREDAVKLCITPLRKAEMWTGHIQ
jgi:hypothetical protein